MKFNLVTNEYFHYLNIIFILFINLLYLDSIFRPYLFSFKGKVV